MGSKGRNRRRTDGRRTDDISSSCKALPDWPTDRRTDSGLLINGIRLRYKLHKGPGRPRSLLRLEVAAVERAASFVLCFAATIFSSVVGQGSRRSDRCNMIDRSSTGNQIRHRQITGNESGISPTSPSSINSYCEGRGVERRGDHNREGNENRR